MKRFSDFAAEPVPLDGAKIPLDSILNRELTITGYSIRSSKYSKNSSGKYLTLQFQLDGEIRITFTGSDVLIGQMEKYGKELPFVSVIKKINRYYTLT